eukprot:TRINITY_DN2165_c0_g1_i5.p1 TRINITY_DN2165_c0_g1~~TRINITY_DN2165_c0_g1_i5.p1  ORF type:complete len:322 (-),score=77.43 TRINITY_DN2165_c0_g1_i5:131-1096(-)
MGTSRALAENYHTRLKDEIGRLLTMDEGENGERHIPDLTHTDLLVIQRRAQEEAHRQAAAEREREREKQCTFRPDVSRKRLSAGGAIERPPSNKTSGVSKTHELYSMARPACERRDRTTEEVEFEKNCDECTFTPQIRTSRNTKANEVDSGQYSKDVGKAIGRMKKARELREEAKQIRERGYPVTLSSRTEENRRQSAHFPLPKPTHNVSPLQNSRSIRDLRMNPHQEVMNNTQGSYYLPNPLAQERMPLLFVDVNLGTGSNERIVVFDGDNPRDLANRFGDEHGLDAEMRMRLRELLEHQINGLLTMIEEEVPTDSDADE